MLINEKLKKKIVIFLIWVFIGILYTAQSYFYRLQIGRDADWLKLLIIDSPYFILWSFFMPLSFFLSRRFPFAKTKWVIPGIVHLTSAISISLIHSITYNIFRRWVESAAEPVSFSKLYLSVFATFDYSLLVYFVMLFIIQVMIYNKRLKEEHEQSTQLKSALVQSQLDVLKSQLQPHFLFNTLNSISVLTRENPVLADKTIHLLSDLLRYSLKHAQQQFVTLEAEISFINDYLAIEKVRFGERLNIEMDIDPQTLQIMVPSLLLQPLVENAIKHGVTKKRGQGFIKISAQKNAKTLILKIIDNGKNKEKQPVSEENFGIGLKNTSKRLQSLYGQNHLFRFENNSGKETIVLIELPLTL